VTKTRKFLAYCICAVMFAASSYGLWRFPDSPVYPCQAHGYCGKQGQRHSLEDFEAFNKWTTIIFWLWPTGMLSAGLLWGTRKPGPTYDEVRATYIADKHSGDVGNGVIR
jgi:hypothetical protein